MNILISSLGLNSEIVEEALGLFNYSGCDFYQGHNNQKEVDGMRKKHNFDGHSVDEVWLIATDKQHEVKGDKHFSSTIEDFNRLKSNAEKFSVKYRLFMLDSIHDIVSEDIARAYHSLTLRVLAFAQQTKGVDGYVYVSLACGRKTMSADVQDAVYCFGCDLLLHVLGDKKAEALPIILGPVPNNVALKLQSSFDDNEIIRVMTDDSDLANIEKQKATSQHFFTSFYMEQGDRNNFHVLYTLPPSKIKELKACKIGYDKTYYEEELEFLHNLPKTELHCHLGGVLNPEEMIEVAKSYTNEIDEAIRSNAKYAKWHDALLKEEPKELDYNWKKWYNKLAKELNVDKGLIVAPYLLLFEEKSEVLKSYMFRGRETEQEYVSIGITPYEALGDLQGSALLCNEKALRRTVQILLENCIKENVLYLEVRCSPLNYATQDFSAQAVMNAILEELEQRREEIESSVIIIASRHSEESKIEECLKFAETMRGNTLFDKYFRGFDLAGAEKAKEAKDVRKFFMNAMKECYNITIHAGETDDVDSVWQAVYELNAERIGHGLKLTDNKELMEKFLERGIGIEMCPSSNYQIVGFKDNYLTTSKELKIYPLKEYLDKELKVSINTDDPGISLTNITNELHKAARLTEGGLSKWQVLQLICNGFRTAFYPYEKKKQLIIKAEQCLAELIKIGKL